MKTRRLLEQLCDPENQQAFWKGFKEELTGKTEQEEEIQRRRRELEENDRKRRLHYQNLYYIPSPRELREMEQDEAWNLLGPLTKADYRIMYVECPEKRMALANAYGEHNLLPY